MSHIKNISFALLLVNLLFSTISYAESKNSLEITKILKLKPNLVNGAKVYKLCATCHGVNGFGKKNGSFPSIANQHQSVIIKQLFAFNSRDRNNPTMYPFIQFETFGGSQTIADVSAYIANLKHNPNNGLGKGKNIEKGKQIYQKNCIACHKVDASGNSKLLYPKLQKQHYAYLNRQLLWIRDEIRNNSNPRMLYLLKKLSNIDINHLSDYISRIKVLSSE